MARDRLPGGQLVPRAGRSPGRDRQLPPPDPVGSSWRVGRPVAGPASLHVLDLLPAGRPDLGLPGRLGRDTPRHRRRLRPGRRLAPPQTPRPVTPPHTSLPQASRCPRGPVPLGDVVNAYHRLSFQIREAGASLTSPTSPGRRPAGIGEVTSHIASHPICRGSYGPGLVAAVPGVLLRSYGAGVDARAVPAKTRRGPE